MFKKVNPSNFNLLIKDFAIKSKINPQEIYMTSKPYINKICRNLGYKSLNTVSILEKYSNEPLSLDLSNLTFSIFIDEDTKNFIVCSDKAIINCNNIIYQILPDSHITKYDNCCYWDEYRVNKGHIYYIYLDLCDEICQVYDPLFDNERYINSSTRSKYDLNDELVVNEINQLLKYPVAFTNNINDMPVSYREFLDILVKTGYITKRRHNYYVNDTKDFTSLKSSINFDMKDIEDFIDEISQMKFSEMISQPFTSFKTYCKLINNELNNGYQFSYFSNDFERFIQDKKDLK